MIAFYHKSLHCTHLLLPFWGLLCYELHIEESPELYKFLQQNSGSTHLLLNLSCLSLPICNNGYGYYSCAIHVPKSLFLWD